MINYYTTLWSNDAQRDNCNLQNCLLQHLSGLAMLRFQFYFLTLIGFPFPTTLRGNYSIWLAVGHHQSFQQLILILSLHLDELLMP